MRVFYIFTLFAVLVCADTIEVNAINQATKIISLMNSMQCTALPDAFISGNDAVVMANNQTMSPMQLCISAVAAYDEYFIEIDPKQMVVVRELDTVTGPCTFRGSLNGTEYSYLFILSAKIRQSDKPKDISAQVVSAQIFYDTEFVNNIF